jgi:hypothetical protein
LRRPSCGNPGPLSASTRHDRVSGDDQRDSYNHCCAADLHGASGGHSDDYSTSRNYDFAQADGYDFTCT